MTYLAPPVMCHFCQIPCMFYLLLAAIFSQGKSSQRLLGWGGSLPPASHASAMSWLCHQPLNVFKVTYTVCSVSSISVQEGMGC